MSWSQKSSAISVFYDSECKICEDLAGYLRKRGVDTQPQSQTPQPVKDRVDTLDQDSVIALIGDEISTGATAALMVASQILPRFGRASDFIIRTPRLLGYADLAYTAFAKRRASASRIYLLVVTISSTFGRCIQKLRKLIRCSELRFLSKAGHLRPH